MKLLYVESSLAIHGGIERVLTDKLNWLVESGKCEVLLLLVNQGDYPIVFPLSSKIDVQTINIMFHRIYRFPPIIRCYKSFKLHRLFRKRLLDYIKVFSPDVIVFTRFEFACDVVSVKGDIPVVYESHNSYLAYKFEKYSLLHRIQIILCHRALKKVQMIVALTNGDAMEWKKLYSHVQVIPNMVHLNDTGFHSDCTNKSVIFVGRFSKQKNIGCLLRIWNVVHQSYPEWQLHIYGAYGDEQNVLISEIEQLDANILVHNPTSDIYKKYVECSILLMTSQYEPFGLVLPEAMSCGLPVVAFDCPYGPADIITDGADGFVIKNKDINEYVDKVVLLIKDEGLRKEMGRKGQINAQRYNAYSIMPVWKQLFDKILNKI